MFGRRPVLYSHIKRQDVAGRKGFYIAPRNLRVIKVDDRSRYAPVVASNSAAAAVPVALLHKADDEAQVNLATRYVEGRMAQGGPATCQAFTDADEARAWLTAQLSETPAP